MSLAVNLVMETFRMLERLVVGGTGRIQVATTAELSVIFSLTTSRAISLT